ncbi:N-acetylneuraminate synthase, partial [Candidatus Falkowbacteria bacterium]|nr:N-acetylneuraminate synthase [Candidatus Falkowbacteria bacterium]
ILSKEEQEMKKIARRSIMAAQKIKKGQIIKPNNLEAKRPGTGLPPKLLPKIIGKKAKKDFKKGYIIKLKDLKPR